MARRRRLWPAHALDAFRHRMRGGVLGGDLDPMCLGLAPVLLHHLMRVKTARDRRRVMKSSQRSGHAPDRFRPAHLLHRDRTAVDEARHEPALVLEEPGHLRAHPHLCRAQPGLVFSAAVDPQQSRPRAAHPQDKGLPAHLHLEVVVGDAALERGIARPPVRPEPLDGGRGVHAGPSLGCA